MDNGSSHRGKKATDRLTAAHPVAATLFALAHSVGSAWAGRRSGQGSQAGEARSGQSRGVHLPEGVAQRALAGAAVAAGQRVEGSPSRRSVSGLDRRAHSGIAERELWPAAVIAHTPIARRDASR